MQAHKDLSFRRREREHNWRDGVVVQVKSDGVVVRMHSRARDDECVHGFVPPYGGGSTVRVCPMIWQGVMKYLPHPSLQPQKLFQNLTVVQGL